MAASDCLHQRRRHCSNNNSILCSHSLSRALRSGAEQKRKAPFAHFLSGSLCAAAPICKKTKLVCCAVVTIVEESSGALSKRKLPSQRTAKREVTSEKWQVDVPNSDRFTSSNRKLAARLAADFRQSSLFVLFFDVFVSLGCPHWQCVYTYTRFHTDNRAGRVYECGYFAVLPNICICI